jgi:hypothetical protein
MSDPGKSGNGHGNGHTTIVSAGIKLGSHVVTSLAPQFLALVLVNILFLGTFVWYVDARAKHSVEVIQQLLAQCLKAQP